MESPLRALLIEDNAGDARLIEEMLKDEGGVCLEWVETLDDGVKRVVDGDVDVVLLDLGLPDSQGAETVGTVHLFDSAVPIVVLTGRVDRETPVEAVQEGAQDYLVKGRFDGRDLVRTIQFALRRNVPARQAAVPSPDAPRPVARALRCPTGGAFVPQVGRYVAGLQEAGIHVVYLCLDRPPKVLAEDFASQGVQAHDVAFVDATAAETLQDPEAIWAAVQEACQAPGPRCRVLLDSVNALLLQYDVDLGAEVVHSLANRLRLLRTGLDVLCHCNQEWAMIADRFSAFLDAETDLEPVAASTEDPSIS